MSASRNNVRSSFRNRKYEIPRMKLSSCHVLILMCRCNVTTSYSSVREDIERKLQVFPEDVVVRCHLIRTPIDALELLLVTRRVDYAGGRTKCQPDKMPTGQNATLGWHFVRDFFSMVGILSRPTFWLAFCPDHLNMSWHPPPPL